MDQYLVELYQTFHDEATEVFEELDRSLLELEQESSPELINGLFRLVHTLKGSANMMGLEGTGRLAHALEDIFDSVRSGKKKVSPDLINIFFEAADCLKLCVSSELEQKPLPEEQIVLITALKAELTDEQNHSKCTSAAPAEDTEILGIIKSYNDIGKSIFEIKIKFDDLCPMRSAAAFLVKETLSGQFEIIRIIPDIESDEIEDAESFIIFAASDNDDPDLIKESASIPGMTDSIEIKKCEITDDSGKDETEKSQVKDKKSQERHEVETLRVNWEKLINLMGYVDELFVGRSKLNQAIAETENDAADSESFDELFEISRGIDKLISRIQGQVMDIRCIPIEPEMGKFKRIIRDACMKLGKDVNFEYDCSETEIDRGVWEELQEIVSTLLLEIINISIEPPEIRKKAGKAITALINFKASYSGTDVLIEISDDGSGIVEINNEIMKNINETIKKIRGKFEINNGEHKNTILEIRVPVNSSTVRVMLVQVGKEMLAFQLSAIKEIVRFKASELRGMTDSKFISYKNRIISLRNLEMLSERYALSQDSGAEKQITGVIISEGDKECLIGVDRIIGQEEIILNELTGENFSSGYIQGVTVLGNGKVIMVIDHRSFI